MINNNFYAVVNDLVTEATGGTITGVIDYSSFIDVGTQLTATGTISMQNLTNAFAVALANKVQLTIDVVRSFGTKLNHVNMGSLTPEGGIELIQHGFYDLRAADFASLTNGGTTPDQYVINKGETKADYYFKNNSAQIPVTIQYDELKGAFRSPEAMDIFLNAKIQYALNSKNFGISLARLGMYADAIIETVYGTYAETAASDVTEASRRYPLLTLYNGINGTTLTADDCLYNKDFLRFSIGLINDVKDKITNRSNSYNAQKTTLTPWDTFTPADDIRTVVNSRFARNIGSYVKDDSFRTEYDNLGITEAVNYWEFESDPLIVKYKDSSSVVQSTPPVVAVVHDKYALMEFTEIDDVTTTPFHASGRYVNNWVNLQYAYCRNRMANLIIFTLE